MAYALDQLLTNKIFKNEYKKLRPLYKNIASENSIIRSVFRKLKNKEKETKSNYLQTLRKKII